MTILTEAQEILYGERNVMYRPARTAALFDDFDAGDIRRLMTGPYIEGMKAGGHNWVGIGNWWYASADFLPTDWKQNLTALGDPGPEYRHSRHFLTGLDKLLADKAVLPQTFAVRARELRPDRLSLIVPDTSSETGSCQKVLFAGTVRQRAIEALAGAGSWKYLGFMTGQVERHGLAYLSNEARADTPRGALLGWLPHALSK